MSRLEQLSNYIYVCTNVLIARVLELLHVFPLTLVHVGICPSSCILFVSYSGRASSVRRASATAVFFTVKTFSETNQSLNVG